MRHLKRYQSYSLKIKFADAHCHFGLLLNQCARYEEAKAHLECAVSLNPTNQLSLWDWVRHCSQWDIMRGA